MYGCFLHLLLYFHGFTCYLMGLVMANTFHWVLFFCDSFEGSARTTWIKHLLTAQSLKRSQMERLMLSWKYQMAHVKKMFMMPI